VFHDAKFVGLVLGLAAKPWLADLLQIRFKSLHFMAWKSPWPRLCVVSILQPLGAELLLHHLQLAFVWQFTTNSISFI